MTSIRDVAKLAGVSVSTVSRVINNSEEVEDRTKQKVLQAIEKLDYMPNLVAKGLRTKRWNLIGLVVPEVMDHAFTYIVSYTMDAAHKKGYSVLLASTHDDPSLEERLVNELLGRKVNGIIFSRVSDESRVLHKLDRLKVPIVIIDRSFDREGTPRVVLNNRRAGEIVAGHLIELGHRRVGCVTGPLKIALCRERLRGFEETLKANNIEITSDHIFEGDFKYESGIDAALYFSAGNSRVSAIWAQNDMMAFGLMKGLMTRGLEVPEDVSLMGMDNLSFGAMIVPSLTTVHYPFREMSEKAVELILMQDGGIQCEEEVIVLEPSLVKRDSTAHAKQM